MLESRYCRSAARFVLAVVTAVVVAVTVGCSRDTRLDLGVPERIADGVLLYRLANPSLLDLPGPIAVQVLRLDPTKIDLRSTLANDRVMALETIPEMAVRTHAIAAVNAGFFVVRNGDPAGLLEVAGELVSETALMRGAFGVVRVSGKPIRLVFDRVTAAVTMRLRVGDVAFTVPIDGIDTTRVRGKLMLYTPHFGEDSDTAGTGVEWEVAGTPPRVTGRRPNAGKTPIPRDGFVLSFGGTVLPTALERLDTGQHVSFDTTFQTSFGTLPDTWAEAADIVGGAGLLVYKGAPVTDWSEEQLRAGFTIERHPRTMIGTSRGGAIWVITVDGRNPQVSVGMTFAELQRLALGLKLTYALNLDGGGSTTMVVKGNVVNHPSDPAGPRKVSDGIVVVKR
jgi:hypothetical protein